MEKQENKNGKKKKRKKEGRTVLSRTQTLELRLVKTLPNRYTTKLIVSFR